MEVVPDVTATADREGSETSLNVEKFWPPTLDRFASEGAHQVPKYFAAVWDSHCAGVNALAQQWNNLNSASEHQVLSAFPPCSLFTKVLAKVRDENPNIRLVGARHYNSAIQWMLDEFPVKVTVDVKPPQGQPLVTPHLSQPSIANKGDMEATTQGMAGSLGLTRRR